MEDSKNTLLTNVPWLEQKVWAWRLRRYLAMFSISTALIILLHTLGFYFQNLLPVERDATRLLLSATAQGLAALLAISLSLAFVFLQVIGGRYSLSLTRVFFDNRLETFLIIFSLSTIGSSLLHLATGGSWLNSPGTVAFPTLTQAVLALVLFAVVFERGVRRISNEPLVTHLRERTHKYMSLYLHCLQDTRYRAMAAESKMRKNHVVLTSYILDADFQLPIAKHGVVEDIRMARLSKLAKKLSVDCTDKAQVIQIDKNVGSAIGPKSTIDVKYPIKNQQQRDLLEHELPKIFKITKPVSWDEEVRWGLNSLVAVAKKGVQDSETPLVEKAIEAIGDLVQRYIEGTKRLRSAWSPDAVYKQFHVKREQVLGHGLELITDLITNACRTNETDSMLAAIYEISEVAEYSISLGNYAGVKEANYAFQRAYLVARHNQNELLYHQVCYYIDRNFGAALRLLENATTTATTIDALSYILRDIVRTVTEFARRDIESGDIGQFNTVLRTLQELPVDAPQIKQDLDDYDKKNALLNEINREIQDSIFQLVSYLIHRVRTQEIDPEVGREYLDRLANAIGPLEETYLYSCRIGRKFFWFMPDTKRVVRSKPYIEQQWAYVLLTLFKISKKQSAEHIGKHKESLDFIKFVPEVLEEVEKEPYIWDTFIGSSSKTAGEKLRDKYIKINEESTLEVNQMPLSEGKVDEVKASMIKGIETNSIGRELSKVIHIKEKPPANLEPLQFRITAPRINFVDSPYHHPPINFPDCYGDVSRRLLDLESHNVIVIITKALKAGREDNGTIAHLKITAESVRKTKEQLSKAGYTPNVLLVGDRAVLWTIDGFQAKEAKDEHEALDFVGTLEGLKIFWNRFVTRDKAVVLDSQKMVQIEVFKELEEDSIIITDRYVEDNKAEDKGDGEQPNEEKVLLIASEIVRISLLDDKAGKVVDIS